MDQQTQENLLALVKRNYQEIAFNFNDTRKKYLWPELIKLASLVKGGDRVLDAGCGNGRLLEILAGKKIEYLGLDSSQELIKIARKNFQNIATNLSSSGERQRDPGIHEDEAQINFNSSTVRQAGRLDSVKLTTGRGNDRGKTIARNDNYKFINGDVLELNKIAENDFDYIFCVAVLHHLPGQALRVRALRQMRDKLKPQGKIIITVWNLWQKAKFNKLIYKFAILKILGKNKMDFGDIMFNWKNSQAESVSRRYYHAFTKNKLKKIIQKAELKIEKLYKDKYNYYAVLIKQS